MTYQIIFTDFNMPIMNGIESTRQIRNYFQTEMKLEKDQQPLIIGVTGHALDLYRQEGIKAGMDEVMSKPIYIHDLKEIFKKYKIEMVSGQTRMEKRIDKFY